MRSRLRAALIDLDGTLLDTLPDLAAAANRMLVELRLRSLPEAIVSDYIGKGVGHLVRRCVSASLGVEPDEALLTRADEVFARAYEDESGRSTRLYPGVLEGLEAMRVQGLVLACVTNKISRYTTPLLERTGIAACFACVVTGDAVSELKPSPEPYLKACETLRVSPSHAVVVGDSDNDMMAARRAGCRSF